MTRVALYARYSSDNQRDASIEDQFRICRDRVKLEGWTIAATYNDAGISGSSMIRRPGIQELVRDAQRGEFDLVLAEALDRISRDQADVATLFKHLQFAGVPIVTLAEGEISELHVGLKGTMNALFLKDLAAKTHRGMRGRVEQGKAGGGLCYGYEVVKSIGVDGEPIRGERRIKEPEAEVVRRVFRDFAAGIAPRAIAKALNDAGVPGPGRRPWNDTTIRGHARRGTGLVNNELYIGRLVWNRQRYLKDPSTGRRVSRINAEADWIVTDVPELRIVDDVLWQAVRTRQAEIAETHADQIEAVREHHAGNRLNRTHRPKALFSGLIFCGRCGGPYSIRGQDRYACSAHVTNGSCDNKATIPRTALEERVLAGLRDRLMAPEVAAEAMRAYAEETNRLNRERRTNADGWRAELAKLERSIAALIRVIEDGLYEPSIKARMAELETRKAELTTLLSASPATVPDLLPSMAELYRRKVERLAETLNETEDRADAAEAIRALVEKITLTPGAKRGAIEATLHGDLATILDWTEHQAVVGLTKTNTPGAGRSGVSASVVAGARFELTTFRL